MPNNTLTNILSYIVFTFHDVIALHYGWPLRRTPHCTCGAVFSIDHALSCGLSYLRHNEIRDLTAHLLTEVYHPVQVEPVLQLISNPGLFHLSTANTQEGAHLDIGMA